MIRPWKILCALLAFASVPALAQTTCPALGPTTGIARDEARLSWDAVTNWAMVGSPPVCPGTPASCVIPVPTQITYTIYERLTGPIVVDNVVCTTTNLGTTLAALSVGAHAWLATAKTPKSTPPNTESLKAGPVGKTIDPIPVTPGAVGNLTVQ